MGIGNACNSAYAEVGRTKGARISGSDRNFAVLAPVQPMREAKGMQVRHDRAAVAGRNRTEAPSLPSGNGRGRVRLLTHDAIDQRTRAYKQFSAIASSIAKDISPDGESSLSTIQKHLIEAFAGCALHVNDLNSRVLRGEQVDLATHAQAVTVLVRVASRLPIGRVAKQIPSMQEFLRALPPQEQHADEAELVDD